MAIGDPVDPYAPPTYGPTPGPYEDYLSLINEAYGDWSTDKPYYWKDQIPPQLEEIYGPRSDSAANIMVNRAMGGAQGWENFSPDVYLQADPNIQPYLGELLANNKGDLIAASNEFNSQAYQRGQGEPGDPDYQQGLRERIGRTAWNQLAQSGDLTTQRGLRMARTGAEKDEIAVDYITRGLENLLAQGAPSLARNVGIQDLLLERQGGRPVPGGELPGYGGPGFGGQGGGAADQGDVPLAQGGQLRSQALEAQQLLEDSYAARQAIERDPFVSDRNLQYQAQTERTREGGRGPSYRAYREALEQERGPERLNPRDPLRRGWGRAAAASDRRREPERKNRPGRGGSGGGGGWLSNVGRVVAGI